MKDGKTFWASAEHLTQVCDGAIEAAAALRDTIKAVPEGKNTIENTLETYNQMSLALDMAYGHAGLMFSVHPDKPIRDAAQTCEQKVAKFASDLGLDRSLYKAVSSVDASAADEHTQRFTTHLLRDFRRSGVDKDEKTRKRLSEINAEMVLLSQSYQTNVRQDVRSIELDDVAGLDGLPDDFIKAHAKNKDGKIVITTDYPDFFPFQTYAKDRQLREKLYRQFMRRGYPKNKEVLTKLLHLRHEYAQHQGFDTWADYNAEDKMVKSAEVVEKFIEQLNRIVRPISDSDTQVVLKRIRQDDPQANHVAVWDRFYYTAKVREEQHNFDAKTVRPYFSYPRVKDGVFQLYGELFGLSFEPLADEPVWHESVDAYLMKADGKVVGKFYLDMHPRAGKYKHAAMFPIQTGLSSDRIPMASLVCNFPDPSKGDGKALMEHNQVVTFFHEFGHLIHHLLARDTRWVSLSGINVEWDFVEAPSQILEEWAWDARVLARFAMHMETGQPISEELVDRMRKASEFGKGLGVMRQVFYTAYSFFLHDRDPKTVDLDAFMEEMYAKYSPYPSMKEAYVYANFGHLVGYSSMYYTYQWSLVIAKDLFTRFRDEGVMNPAVARAYREHILEPGGTRDAADLVEGFLGRPYNLDAYKAWLEK